MTIEEKILETLSTQRFADWFADDGEFGKWITGDVEYRTPEEREQARKQLLENIKTMFGLE